MTLPTPKSTTTRIPLINSTGEDAHNLQYAKANMKKVILIGDSIRLGYGNFVKDSLKEVAEVYAPEENCEFAQHVFVHLSRWRRLAGDPSGVDLVHWNCGQWDSARFRGDPRPLNSHEVYADMLERINLHIAKIFPNAKIVFATTTPMNPNGELNENPRTTAEIAGFNEVARKVMKRMEVHVNDLFDLMSNADAGLYTDCVHFNETGYRLLARKVTDTILELLDL